MNVRQSARFHVTEILKSHFVKSLVDSFRCFFCPYKHVYGAFNVERYNIVVQILFRAKLKL
jgi:hypothetical protein